MLKKIAAVFIIAFGVTATSCNPTSKIQQPVSTISSDTIYTKGRVNKHKPEPVEQDDDVVEVIAGEIQYVQPDTK